MEPALKQRLLGAAVIVALAVIIIPFLLDGSGTEPVSDVPLPPEPQTAQQGPVVTNDHVPMPAEPPQSQIVDEYTPPGPPAAAPAPRAAQSMPAPQTSPPEVATEPEPAPASAPSSEPEQAPTLAPAPSASAPAASQSGSALHGWVVQVGSFGEQDKATALRDRLRKSQFKAFVERFQSGSGQPMYRVRVGPVPQRPEAEQLQQTLEAQEKLKGFVTQHP